MLNSSPVPCTILNYLLSLFPLIFPTIMWGPYLCAYKCSPYYFSCVCGAIIDLCVLNAIYLGITWLFLHTPYSIAYFEYWAASVVWHVMYLHWRLGMATSFLRHLYHFIKILVCAIYKFAKQKGPVKSNFSISDYLVPDSLFGECCLVWSWCPIVLLHGYICIG